MADPEGAAGSDWRYAWRHPEPGRLIGPGHPVGDFLDAHEWELLERIEGRLRVRAHLPDRVRNPRGQLFGGFTPTYVDFVALHTWWAGRELDPGNPWLATAHLRVDYFEPIVGDRIEIDSRVVHRRGASCWIETRFLGLAAPGSPDAEAADRPEGPLLALAHTTLKAV